jgi:hypothetical protein
LSSIAPGIVPSPGRSARKISTSGLGACRVAALASHVVYADSIEEGRSGLLFQDVDELRERLLRLVAMPELARGLGNAARSYVAGERMLAYQVAARIAWYRSLWARRVELTNALYGQMMAVPQLADGPALPQIADGPALP